MEADFVDWAPEDSGRVAEVQAVPVDWAPFPSLNGEAVLSRVHKRIGKVPMHNVPRIFQSARAHKVMSSTRCCLQMSEKSGPASADFRQQLE